MGPTGDIILTLEVYSHDVAAAFLAVGLALVRILMKRYPAPGEAALEIPFLRVFAGATQILRYSICWIVVTGVPAAVFFTGRGLRAPGDLKSASMAIKYAGLLVLSVVVFLSWSRLSKKVGYLKSRHTIND
jgi:hypothetical protein